MNTVPEMISTKDLDYIKDMLNWNFIAAKKANHYLEYIEDQEVAAIISQINEMHIQHYNILLDILNQGGQNE
ncbi:MAG: spore coat protein [Bacilli bacterium]|nr:spore coat protein [Bacilli bacterium]MDD4643850.1 spore coat protein [Bacilli bacterium]